MTITFTTIKYDETHNIKVSLREALPLTHKDHNVVDIIAQLNLSNI